MTLKSLELPEVVDLYCWEMQYGKYRNVLLTYITEDPHWEELTSQVVSASHQNESCFSDVDTTAVVNHETEIVTI